MQKKNFLLEVVLDRSYFEKPGCKGKFLYRTESRFLNFEAADMCESKKKADKLLKQFIQRKRGRIMIVTTRLFKEIIR